MLRTSTKIWLGVLGLAAGAVGLLWARQPGELPAPRPAAEFTMTAPARLPSAVSDEAPVAASGAEINLAVPFAPQAPNANWEQPYQDACEEAAIIMAERYLRGADITLEEMDVEILRLVDLQEANFGFYKDSNTAETVRLAEAAYPHLTARAVYDIGANDIRMQLAIGQPVVVLVDGRQLGNPYYTGAGPDKHALVIKGFTDNSFITNDPGTRRGADFIYSETTLMSAMVDYDGGTPGTGKRAMIVLSNKP